MIDNCCCIWLGRWPVRSRSLETAFDFPTSRVRSIHLFTLARWDAPSPEKRDSRIVGFQGGASCRDQDLSGFGGEYGIPDTNGTLLKCSVGVQSNPEHRLVSGRL